MWVLSNSEARAKVVVMGGEGSQSGHDSSESPAYSNVGKKGTFNGE